MILLDNNSFSFDIERCCQCGTCLAACTPGALFSIVRPDGLYEIKRHDDKCNSCGLCAKVCPSRLLPDNPFLQEDWDKFRAIYQGRSSDVKIAKASSSGGVARTIIKTAIERSMYDRAYCLVKTEKYPWAKGEYLDKKIDISSITNSMYLPVLANANLEKITIGESLLLVGTNCQLIGADNFYRKSNINTLKIAILCKQQKNFEFTRFVGRLLKEYVGMETPVRYRGDGWPGKMKVGQKEINYRNAAALPFGKRLWTVPGCRFCGNPFGLNADITLADPWGLKTDEKYGENLIWIRTKKGEKLLECCRDNIIMKHVSLDESKKSVAWKEYQKKQVLINYYMGVSFPTLYRLLINLAQHQRSLYETLLERYHFPRIILKIFGKTPFLEDLVLSRFINSKNHQL
jgi:coenzyme F420-reducing hydrogenase beta subunit